MYREVIKWLKMQSMPVSENYLRLRLESHPDYPSLVAVADSLDEIGIECAAYQTNKEEVIKTGKPFLAHFNLGEGHIQYFHDMETAQRNVKDFDKHWSGVVLLAEKCGKYGNAEHDRQYRQEKQTKVFLIISVSITLLTLAGLTFYHNSIPALLHILFNITGLCFSWLITQKEFGISNSISDKICNMAKQSRCESVLFSKGAKLFNWLSWGDVGMVYFTSSLLYVFISLLANQQINLQLFHLISLTGFLFPLYSLYYQWKVVKQWCMLCIGVLAALLLNAVIGIIFIKSPIIFTKSVIYSALVFSVLTVIILAAWQVLKALYQKSLVSLTNEIKATRLKRNPKIFNALLEKQEINPANLPKPDEAIQFGNPAAPYQILIACNPYCGPCAKAHQAIEYLYEKYPEQFSVTVRFALQKNDDNDTRVVTAKEIMKVAKTKPLESVKDWYSLLNLEKFRQLHHTNGEQVDAAVDKHIEWSKAAGIKATPTIFLNGRMLPELYSWFDLTETLEFTCR